MYYENRLQCIQGLKTQIVEYTLNNKYTSRVYDKSPKKRASNIYKCITFCICLAQVIEKVKNKSSFLGVKKIKLHGFHICKIVNKSAIIAEKNLKRLIQLKGKFLDSVLKSDVFFMNMISSMCMV